MQNIHEGLLINLNPSNVVSNKPNGGTKINKGKLLKETYKVMNNFPIIKHLVITLFFYNTTVLFFIFM